MKKKSMNVLLAVCLLICVAASGQNPVKPLKIGDTVSDREISGIINYRKTSVKFSDFKDRLLILDFWATWCGPCITAFPKQDALQKKFGEKIMILPVTSEDKPRVEAFLKKMKTVKNVLPYTATGDRDLQRIFAHSTVPHYVWIYKGVVTNITGGEDVTEGNIQSLLSGGKVTANVKSDFATTITYTTEGPAFSPSLQLMSEDGISTELIKMPDTSLVFYSSISKYLEGMGRGYLSYHKNLFTAYNLTILELYRIALLDNSTKAMYTGPNSVVLDIEDSVLYNMITMERIEDNRLEAMEMIRKHAYCFDIKVPKEFINDKFKIMTAELNRYFGAVYGIEGLLEQRKAKYLALITTGSVENLKTKGGPIILESDKFSLKARRKSLNAVINSLIQPLQKHPLILNETGIKEDVDMDLNCALSDFEAVNKELSKYGLKLVEKEKVIEIPVIRKKKQA